MNQNEASKRMSIIVIVAFSIFDAVRCQGVINGDPYFCTPPGICTYSGGIDPRITTPNGAPAQGFATCPSGKVPCYAQGRMSNCGQSLVSVNNRADGDAEFGAYPWQAFIMGPSGNFIGSGSLGNPAQITVVMGVNDPSTMNNPPAAPRSRADQITIYSSSTYDNSTLKNDIAIIRLANPISLVGQNTINTICLPPYGATSNTYSAPSQRCLVSGWGQIQPNNYGVPTRLKQVAVSTTDINTCANGFAGKVNAAFYLDMTGGQICAGGEGQKDACFQDGGAPLTCGSGTAASRFTVAGIVIWGKSCGQPGVYGVYTNVPFYRDWIVQVITQPTPQ